MATMTRILTVSSGAATPNTECNACATQGFSGPARIEANGARATPNREMLAAPSRNAVQTLAGGPGRSPAAITSHSISSAGATAAVPMTVGVDSRSSIASGAEQNGGQALGGGTGALASGDHEPQHQQRGCDGRGADDRGDGLKEQH